MVYDAWVFVLSANSVCRLKTKCIFRTFSNVIYLLPPSTLQLAAGHFAIVQLRSADSGVAKIRR